MPKLDEQIKTLAGYFAADCEPDGKLTLQLEVEHFLTRSDGEPPAFADVQAALRDLQQQTDAPIITDGEYFGYSGPALTATLGPACQLRISLAPLRDVQDIMDLYNRFYLQLGLALAAHGLRAWTAGCHPTCHAEDLPPGAPHPGRGHGRLPAGKGGLQCADDARHGGDACVH